VILPPLVFLGSTTLKLPVRLSPVRYLAVSKCILIIMKTDKRKSAKKFFVFSKIVESHWKRK
jgi:hypothetical protein